MPPEKFTLKSANIASTPPLEEPAYPLLGRALTRADLATLPKPEPLIVDWLDLRTAVVVIGDTGTNKTFVVLGWCCSIATGRPWLDHAVKIGPTPVVLIVGEGAFGLHDRITAWEAENGATADTLYVFRQPPGNLTNPEFWDQVTDFARECGARFVALDTFSSLAPSADETDDAAQVVRL